MFTSLYKQTMILEGAIDSLEQDKKYVSCCLMKTEPDSEKAEEYREWLRDICDEIQERNEDLTQLLRELEE